MHRVLFYVREELVHLPTSILTPHSLPPIGGRYSCPPVDVDARTIDFEKGDTLGIVRHLDRLISFTRDPLSARGSPFSINVRGKNTRPP
jgi:hypothetical protein